MVMEQFSRDGKFIGRYFGFDIFTIRRTRFI